MQQQLCETEVDLQKRLSWRRVRRAISASTPVQVPNFAIPAIVQVRAIPRLMEPCIVGWRRPILLLPLDITERLTQRQLEAVLAHEMCHVSRRDNLFAAIHMLTEAVFWFHPLVWWIGARLVQERERSCDEEVGRMGNEPLVYAEGILQICKNYTVSPLPWVSGVSGSNLRMRIQNIVTARVAWNLTGKRKALLVAAGLCAVGIPLAVGMMHAASGPFQERLQFEVASIRPDVSGYMLTPDGNVVYAPEIQGRSMFFGCHGTDGPAPSAPLVPAGRCVGTRTTLRMLLANAYDIPAPSNVGISGGPDWMDSDAYAIEAKAETPSTNRQLQEMLRTLLADRFKLRFHPETRQTDGFVLAVARDGSKLKAASDQSEHPKLNASMIGGPDGMQTTITAVNYTFADFVKYLSSYSNRPVLDRTELHGKYDFTLGPFGRLNSPNPSGPSIVSTLQEQLGLRLDSQKIPIQVLVIDYVEKPTAN